MAEVTREELKSAILQSGQRLYAVGFDLSGVQLARAGWLVEAELTYANLIRADLSYSNLNSAELARANMSEADLSGASLVGAQLNYVNLTHAKLCGSNLHNASLQSADLRGAQYNLDTRWPEGFNPQAAGCILVR